MTDERPVVDETTLEGVREIMEDAFGSLIESYLEEAASLFEDLSAASRAGNADGLSRAAHSLKSSSANIGAMRLSEVARVLEFKGRAGDIADAAPLVDKARNELEAVAIVLQSYALR